MKGQLLCLLGFIFIAGALAVTVTHSTCTAVTSGCLNGMTVTSTYYRNHAACRDRIVYTFNKTKCDISYFVARGARPSSYLTTTGTSVGQCASDYGSTGYNPNYCASYFGAVWGDQSTGSTSAYKINTDAGCAGYTVVDMLVPSGDYKLDDIGLKGGTDCTLCQIYVYTPLASVTTSLGACSVDADCNDNNACTTDTCNSDTTCSTCSNVNTGGPLCFSCVNDTDCAGAPYIDECTDWICNQYNGTCEKYTKAGCFACQTSSDCPVVGDPSATCIQNECVAGVCQSSTIEGCCEEPTVTTTTTDSCYTCTKKTGCGFTDTLECVPNNGTTATTTTTTGGVTTTYNASFANCTTFQSSSTGGSSSSGGGLSGGEVAGIVVPIVVVTALAGLAGLVFAAALAALIAKKMQKGAIASQLQAIGFSEQETDLIVNSALYKGEGGENPFFITTDDTGARVLHVN